MSETEFERLYQEFVRRGGGTTTFDGLGKTPVEYYDALSDTSLSLAEQAALTAAQEQYNRQLALNSIADALGSPSTAFNNPYNTIAENGIASYTDLATSPEYLAISDLYNAINSLISSDPTTADLLMAYLGLSNSTGTGLIDQGRSPFGIINSPSTATDMYTSLQNHTNSQIQDLPKTLQDASSLAGMNAQFGEQPKNSCDLFNQLMGILSGIFDGALDFMGDIVSKIKSMISPFLDVLNGIKDKIMGFINGIVSDLLGAIGTILGPLKDALSKMFGAIGDIANQIGEIAGSILGQIANEAAGLLNMLEDLLNKAKALAMAAAAFDPCQLAVLMNVGGPAIQSAMSTLTAPLASAPSPIPTETDSRANATTVEQTMQEAGRAAAAAPGVPQSPFTALAKLYQPMSAYLHSKISEVTGILSEAFQTISNAAGGATVTRLPQQNVLGSQSSIVPTDAVPDAIRNAPNLIRSFTHQEFSSQFSSNLLSSRNDTRSLRLEIEGALSSGSLESNPDALASARRMIEQLNSNDRTLSSVLTATSDSLTYTSTGSNPRSVDREAEISTNYENVLKPRLERTLTRSESLMRNLTSQWNSIKPTR
jgi:hypothetical protein